MARITKYFPLAQRIYFFQGVRAILPSLPGIAAWSLVTAIAMVKSTLTLAQTLGMSLFVYAGSSQLAVLPLIALAVPVWTVLLTAAIINLRFVVFSAVLQPHFKCLPWWRRLLLSYLSVDITFILFSSHFSASSSESISTEKKEAYFYGLALPNMLMWQGSALLGILLAQYIPDSWGLSLAGILVMLALLLPLVATRSGLFAGMSAAVVSVLAHSLPYKLNLILAVLSAVTVGLITEHFLAKRSLDERR